MVYDVQVLKLVIVTFPFSLLNVSVVIISETKSSFFRSIYCVEPTAID